MWKKIKDLFSVKIEGVDQIESQLEGVDGGAALTCRSSFERRGRWASQSGPNLSDLIRQYLALVFRADGFTGSGRNFRKNHSNWVLVLSIETSRAGDAFTINVGVQPKFAPDSPGKEVDPKKIKVQLCEFRRRVFTPDIDVWWKCDVSAENAPLVLQAAAQITPRKCEPLCEICVAKKAHLQ